MLKLYFNILLLFIFISSINAQVIDNPIANIKSHPTLDINKIEINKDNTILHLSITNQLENDGQFCVDSDVYISVPGKSIKYKMLKSEGIENCPKVHSFTQIGEKVVFKLFFPPINDTIIELDLIENCTENCFFIKGIILDQNLTEEMYNFDVGVNYYRSGNKKNSLAYFENIANKSNYKNSKHYAYSLYIVPVIYSEIGKAKLAQKAYNKLIDSNILEKEYFINKIKEITFFQGL